jgi:hypothetical protein
MVWIDEQWRLYEEEHGHQLVKDPEVPAAIDRWLAAA